MRDATGQLPDGFHFLRLLRSIIRSASFRQVSRDLGKSHDLALGILDSVDHDACPELALVLANPPTFGFEFAGLGSD